MDDHFENITEINGKPAELKRISKDRVVDVDQKLGKGIDGVYENAHPPPKYVISDAKFGKSDLNPITKDGRQMGKGWINGSRRLEKAVGEDLANKIKLEKLLNPKNVQSVITKVDDTGKTTTYIVDNLGKIIGTWK